MDLLKECAGAERIGIGTHIRPDGDAVGACMALYYYLQKAMPGAQIKLFMETPSNVFLDLKHLKENAGDFSCVDSMDVFFALDCEQSRLGEGQAAFAGAGRRINIDHHISNQAGCGDVNVVEPHASSTCEVLYGLLETDRMDEDIAKALYIGIIHDCGVFQYSSTSARTLRIAAELITYGFNFSKIIEETFYQKTYIQNQIMGRAMMESIRFMHGRCIVSCVDRKMMEFYGVGPVDLDGIVNQLKNTKGVDCAVFMYETGHMEYKVSMRSNENADVSRIASWFGGGGHMRAAGCTMRGTFHDVINNLSLQIEEQLQDSVRQTDRT